MANFPPDMMPDGIHEKLKEELLKTNFANPSSFLSGLVNPGHLKMKDNEPATFDVITEQFEKLKAEQKRHEELLRQEEHIKVAEKMAMHHKYMTELDHAKRIIQDEYPELYHDVGHHYEFEHRLEHEMRRGRHPTDATHEICRMMYKRHRDLNMCRMYGNTRNHRYTEMTRAEMDHSRHSKAQEMLRNRQQFIDDPVYFNPRNDLMDSASYIPDHLKKNKKPKKLSIMEQLQSDVDDWLKDSLKLDHLEGIKL